MENNLSKISITQDQIRKVFETCDLAESTIKQHTYNIKTFIAFVEKNNRSINGTTLGNFKRELKKSPLETSTKNGQLSAAIVLLRQLHYNNPDFPDYSKGVKLFKDRTGHKRDGLNEEEIRRLVKHITGLEKSVEKLRLVAVFMLKYMNGFRDCELNLMDVGHIDFENETALILGKGRDTSELVYLHPLTVKALKEYLGYTGIKSGAVFVSFSRNDSQGERLSTRSLSEIIRRALLDAGIAKPTVSGRYTRSPHGLRHSFITKGLEITGGNVPLIMQLARLESIQTITKYNDRRTLKQDLKPIFEGFKQI